MANTTYTLISSAEVVKEDGSTLVRLKTEYPGVEIKDVLNFERHIVDVLGELVSLGEQAAAVKANTT